MHLFGDLLRRLGLYLVIVACATATGTTANGQALSRPESAVGLNGWPLRFTYHPAPEKTSSNATVDRTKAPVVLLLHGENGDRTFWDKASSHPSVGGKPFAELLQSQGYAVISLDQRKHGQSVREGQEKVTPQDYMAMVQDLVAIKDFIFREHQKQNLNMRKMAIVALDDSAPIAAAFAEYDWLMPAYDDHAIPSERTPRGGDVRALVLVSPTATAGRVQATKSLRTIGNPALGVAVMVAVGKKDASGAKVAASLFRQVNNKANEGRVRFDEFETNERSQHLFANPRIKIELPILQFLKTNVQDQDFPWIDRRSRTERD